MKRFSILLILLFLTGCAAAPVETSEPTLPTPTTEAPVPTETTVPVTTTPPDPIQELLDSMTIEERVGQLFLARCNAKSALTDIQEYHLGGFVLFGEDFEGQTPDSLRQTLSGYQAAAGIPMLLADPLLNRHGIQKLLNRVGGRRCLLYTSPSPRDSH